jgi:hypothetical protein
MKDKSKTKDIADGVVFCLHVFNVDNLRSNIARSSTSHEEVLISFSKLSKTKICYNAFPRILCAEDKIFWFKVAMHNPFSMHFFEPLQNGVSDHLNLIGSEFVLGFDFIIELPSF